MPNGPNGSKRVTELVDVGLPLTEAIAKAMGCSLSAFARRRDVRQEEISMCLLGYPGRIYTDIRDAICDELGIAREFLDEKIEEQAARNAATAESA